MTRKEAIKALEARLISDDVIYVADISYPQALAFAINELKSQEPRVMTLEEAKSVEGYVWVEFCGRPILAVYLFRDGFLLEPFEEPFPMDSMDWPNYNKWWRYWTSRPTDEQREATPWE